MIIRIKLIHVHHVTESNPYKCEKNLLFKYEKIETVSSPLPDETIKHLIGKTEGGSQDDCIDLCNGAEGCHSFFYLKETTSSASGTYSDGTCYLSSIEVKGRPPGDWKAFAKSCVARMYIYI